MRLFSRRDPTRESSLPVAAPDSDRPLLESLLGICLLPAKKAQQRNQGPQTLAPERVKELHLAPKQVQSERNRCASAPTSRPIDDLDLAEPPVDGWLVALPDWGACPAHGHGYWWEDKLRGDLHCVPCTPTPPPRSLVARVWGSRHRPADDPHFASGQSVVFCPLDRLHWPWPDSPAAMDTEDQW